VCAAGGLLSTPPTVRPLPGPRARLSGIVPPAESRSAPVCRSGLARSRSSRARERGAPTCRSGYPRAVIRRARFKCLGSRSARSKSAAGFIVTPVKQKWVLLSIEIKKIRFDKILKVRSSKAFKKGKNERSIFFGIKCPKSCDGLFVFFGALSVDFDRPPFSHSATTGRS